MISTRSHHILSPMVTGSGAILSHFSLEEHIPGYRVCPISPLAGMLPLMPPIRCRGPHNILHTTPDLAPFFWPHHAKTVVTFRNYVHDREMRRYSSNYQWLHYQSYLMLLTKLSLNFADCITTVSHFLANLLRREHGYARKIHVIYNAVDTNTFRPPPHRTTTRRFRVLVSGNLSRRKGTDLLPQIADHLDPGIDILYTQGLRGRGRIPAHPRLTNLGPVPFHHMPELYRSVHLLLFPTVREGFGRVVLEAMASGLPIVASNCSAIPELLLEGAGGLLCSVGDTLGFASCVNSLAADPIRCNEMGSFNRSRAETHFQVPDMIQKYIDVFDTVASAQ